MVEPIRVLLDAGVQSDRVERDERWLQSLHQEVLDAEVELSSLLLETDLHIGDFLKLRPGDVIPVNLPELCTVFAEDVPIFRGQLGRTGGHKAVRFQTPAGRRETRASAEFSTGNPNA
jgi:flagellar motor switch protein FliM